MAFAEELRIPTNCGDCDTKLELDVHTSAAGYYIGAWCNCGPYARLSDYFRTREAAQAELNDWNTTGVRVHARTPGYLGDNPNTPGGGA